MNPTISCICPVAPGHERFLDGALKCFVDQTYTPRELIIAGHQPGRLIVGDWGIPPFTIPPVPSIEGLPLGEIRNRMCEVARGELIAHFDVDDWSHPERLAVQVDVMRNYLHSGRPLMVSGFRTALFHDVVSRQVWRFLGEWTANLGSSLIYRRCWWMSHPFDPAKRVGEDADMVNGAAAAGVYWPDVQDRLLVCREHALNTHRRGHDGPQWVPCVESDLPEEYRRVEVEGIA